MWRQAVSELRLHPGRFVATLVAIAISVGFISAISVFVNSQQTAMASLSALQISRADLVVETPEGKADPVAEAARAVDGVSAAAVVDGGWGMFLSNDGASVLATMYTPPVEGLAWAEITEGRMPSAPDEVALSGQAMDQLGVRVGGSVAVEGESVTVVGRTDDPRTLWAVTGYTGRPSEASGWATDIAVRLAPGVDADEAAAELKAIGDVTAVVSADDERNASLVDMTGDFDVFKYMLQGFAAIALLVGMITIANTFTILAAQRRRQLALLRTIGATPGQVTGRLLVESLLLGATGSFLGLGLGFLVAWIGGIFTGSNFFGLTVNPLELTLAWVVGVLTTVVAAVGPSLRAARVKPLEALQTVPTPAEARRAGVVRVVVCAVAGAIAVWAFVMSRQGGDWAMAWAICVGILLTIAVLGAAPFYVAPLLRLGARILGPVSPTTRLAFTNAARNPQRAASTAMALMLAVGLIVTLQVGLATARSSGMEAINARYPVDVALTLQGMEGDPDDLVADLRAVDGVKAVAPIVSKPIELDGGVINVSAPAQGYAAIGLDTPTSLLPADGTIVLAPYGPAGDGPLTVQTATGPLELKAKLVEAVPYDVGWVTEATFASLTGEPTVTAAWVQLTDRSSLGALDAVLKVVAKYPGLYADGGGAVLASMLTQVLGVMLIVLTALLGVAVLIALVGVGNTLGLSVIERQRESALLRALGMQRAGLRRMLLIEAVALVGIGTVIGLLAGMFFGWLGVSTAISLMPEDKVELRFSLDWLYTAGLVGVCLLAAVLASVLPGRRAANATPTEALAID